MLYCVTSSRVLKATLRYLPPSQAKSGRGTDYAKNTGGLVPLLLSFDTRWRLLANFMPRLLYARGKGPRYILNTWRGGPPNPNKSFRGGGKSVAGPGNRNEIHPLSSPQLYRLRYKATAERMTSKLLLVHSFGKTSPCSFTFGLQLT